MSASLRPRRVAPWLLLLGALSTGCTSLEELRACSEVIEVMNPLLAEIQSEAPDSSATLIRLQASRYRAMVDAMSEARRGPASLAPRITAVMSEFRRIAQILDEAAQAREAEELDRYLAARTRLDASRLRLQELRRQLARRCTP
ncbi:MAG TPA: hypothetical protein VLC09_15045 [Polyangiaceae bacterium]|nr:hypothetical protein [Polyangiaceae bacterium]